jgi:hypothetical protein
MTYTIDMSEEMAERIASAVLRQIRKETTSGGVMEACAIVLTHLEPVLMKKFDERLNDYTEEFPDSGFTDDFGVGIPRLVRGE